MAWGNWPVGTHRRTTTGRRPSPWRAVACPCVECTAARQTRAPTKRPTRVPSDVLVKIPGRPRFRRHPGGKPDPEGCARHEGDAPEVALCGEPKADDADRDRREDEDDGRELAQEVHPRAL